MKRCMRAMTAVTAAAMCAGALCGCRVDQAAEVGAWRRVLDGEQPRAVSWTAGQPLTLEQAMELANAHNERLGLQGEAYLQALIAKDRAAAAFKPTIQLGGSYSIQNDTNIPGSQDYSAQLTASGGMNVFNGFSDLAAFRAAGQNALAKRALLLDAQAAVLLDVARTYYEIVRSEKLVEVLTNSIAVQEERVRDIRARQAAGLARPLDVAQTEAQASATRVSLIAARNVVATGRATLSFLVGADVGDAPLTDNADVPGNVATLSRMLELAASCRQDLAAARYGVQAAAQQIQAAVGRYYPSVSVNLSYFLYRDPSSPLDWTAALSANLPVFSAGLIEADVRAAWSALRQAQLSESQTRRSVIQAVQTAYTNLQSSEKRLRELRVQVEAAGEALRQAEQSYRAGLATNLERLTAQDSLLSAQLQLTSEMFNRKVYYLELLRAAGLLSMRLPQEPATVPATAPATQPATAQP